MQEVGISRIKLIPPIAAAMLAVLEARQKPCKTALLAQQIHTIRQLMHQYYTPTEYSTWEVQPCIPSVQIVIKVFHVKNVYMYCSYQKMCM